MTKLLRQFLRTLAYRKELIVFARMMGLSRVLRNGYFRLVAPDKGILDVRVGEQTARFHVQSAEELRILESLGGGEEAVLKRVLAETPPGAVVLDVGANIGLYSVFLGQRVDPHGKVVAFEPNSNNFDHLHANLQLNGLDNATCFQKALGDSEQQGNLVQGDIIGNYRLVDSQHNGHAGETVEIVAADEFFLAAELPTPTIVKIDVEGFEYAALQGMKRILNDEACRLICIEVHPYLLPAGVNVDMVMDTLKTAGFDRQEIHKRTRDFHAIMWKSQQSDG